MDDQTILKLNLTSEYQPERSCLSQDINLGTDRQTEGAGRNPQRCGSYRVRRSGHATIQVDEEDLEVYTLQEPPIFLNIRS